MKLAVAVDGSDNAFRAAQHAIMLAKHLPEVHLEIIYVVDYNKAKDDRLLTQSPESLVLKREQIVHSVIELAKSVNVEIQFTKLKGNPSHEIVEYVNGKSIDQLVIGSRGLNTFQEMILGSVSHKVMKLVKCPVTIVK